MTASRALCLAAAAAAFFWFACNAMTLATDGVYFRPGGRQGIGAWTEAADSAAVCAFSMAIYALIPAFLLFLGLRRPAEPT